MRAFGRARLPRQSLLPLHHSPRANGPPPQDKLGEDLLLATAQDKLGAGLNVLLQSSMGATPHHPHHASTLPSPSSLKCW